MRIETFEEFWPFYLSQHSKPATRWMHFGGTSLVVVAAAVAVATRRPALLFFLPLLGYGPAWVSHFYIEGNQPATFTYPGWSLRADFKMWLEMLQGQRWH
ncbi:MAG: Mpo1-like protein [Candidatus Xenobia bacterium]